MDTEIISSIRTALKQQADEETRRGAQSFFKESALFYGVKTALVNKIAAEHFRKIKDCSKQDIFSLCEELMRSDYNEEAFIACEWAYRLKNKYETDDFLLFEVWIDEYVNNWAKCDTFCNHTVGSFLEKYPQYLPELKRWAKQENRWMRRAAAVSLIVPARKGHFLPEVFTLADILLHDEDDLVRKGYGWMLKEASRKHQREVFDYVLLNKKTMPRTALRYAIEKMPPELRQTAMAPSRD